MCDGKKKEHFNVRFKKFIGHVVSHTSLYYSFVIWSKNTTEHYLRVNCLKKLIK